jgi:hypothetical protein
VPRSWLVLVADKLLAFCSDGAVGVIVTVLTWPVTVSTDMTGVGVHVILELVEVVVGGAADVVSGVEVSGVEA